MLDVSAICFDLDDTLCAYWRAVDLGLREVFAEVELPELGVDDLVLAWAKEFRSFCPGIKTSPWYAGYLASGEPTRTELMRRTFASVGCDDADLARRVADDYAEARARNLELFDDAIDVLGTLARDYPLVLVTNGPADVQSREVRDLGIERFFRAVLIEGQLGFGKPNPEVLHLAETAAEQPSERMLFVGNSYAHDIAPALARGWKGVWVRRAGDVPPSASGTGRGQEELPEGAAVPHATIGELSELRGLLAATPSRRD